MDLLEGNGQQTDELRPDQMRCGGRGKVVSKMDVYKWGVKDEPGEFAMIGKELLHVDHAYQRDKVSKVRVLSIARNWSWAACGTLAVSRRGDGRFWVFDGQSRKMAADLRTDVEKLPCLVFAMGGQVEEAAAFVSANAIRGPVKAVDKFKAMVLAGDVAAGDVQAIIKHYGYRADYGSRATTGVIECVGFLLKAYRVHPLETEGALWLCAGLAGGGNIAADVVKGVYYVLAYCTIRDEPLIRKVVGGHGTGFEIETSLVESLANLGYEAIRIEMKKVSAALGRSDIRSFAQAIVLVHNKNKRTGRISHALSAKDA